MYPYKRGEERVRGPHVMQRGSEEPGEVRLGTLLHPAFGVQQSDLAISSI